MPGIEVEGFRIVVNTRDERGHKPHVHVIKDRENCKSSWTLHSNLMTFVCRGKNVRRARELVGDHFAKLARLWEEFNG